MYGVCVMCRACVYVCACVRACVFPEMPKKKRPKIIFSRYWLPTHLRSVHQPKPTKSFNPFVSLLTGGTTHAHTYTFQGSLAEEGRGRVGGEVGVRRFHSVFDEGSGRAGREAEALKECQVYALRQNGCRGDQGMNGKRLGVVCARWATSNWQISPVHFHTPVEMGPEATGCQAPPRWAKRNSPGIFFFF